MRHLERTYEGADSPYVISTCSVCGQYTREFETGMGLDRVAGWEVNHKHLGDEAHGTDSERHG